MLSKKIKYFIKIQTALANNILAIDKMLKGAYVVTHTACGRPTCRCVVDGELHKHGRLAWRENKSAYVRAVPAEDVKWIKQMTKNYQHFKKMQHELLAAQDNLNDVIKELRDEIIHLAKQGKTYLNVGK